jgi:pyruvyltransferase
MKLANLLQSMDFRYQQWKCRNLLFADFSRPIKKNRVNLYYWKPGAGHNVGDLISLVLVQKIVESLDLDFEKQIPETRRLFAIGSIVELAVQGVTIWGSGLHHSVLRPHDVDLDVRAVRGPLTRDALVDAGHKCPETFGDPAILLPKFYQPTPKRATSFLLIPHFSKEKDFLETYPANTLSTQTSDWRGFVDAIAGAELVISGSLHGIVLAEAYGVPAILLASAMDRDEFKYRDYYYGTGRLKYDVAPTVDKALTMGGQVLPALENYQAGLIKAFPKDLWQS